MMINLNDSAKNNNYQENSSFRLATPNLQLFNILSSEFSVIPLKPRSKSPFERNWPQWCHKKRPWDPADFDENRNAGICCGLASNILVLDVDNPELFDNWLNEHRHVLPETRIVKTGSGKYHYYFQYPEDGLEYGIKVLKHNGVKCGEIRGVGSMVVAPGSIHPETGQPYSWATMPDASIVQPPQWLLNLYRNDLSFSDDGQMVTSGRQETSDVDALNVSDFIKDLITKPIPVGQRSERMMSVLNALVRAGFPDAQIISIFDVYPIGEKYTEKGPSRHRWLQVQIRKARDFVKCNINPVHGCSAAELLAMEFKDPLWAIPGVVTEGLTLLCGKPKVGKSWMALGLAMAVSSGGKALGTIDTEPGRVIYLALEDSLRRLQRRLIRILQKDGAPENLHLYTSWPKLDQGGLALLKAWLCEHPDTKLIIIDTLARVRQSSRRTVNLYDQDYAALEGLKSLADEHSLAILVVHHLRKMESEDPLETVSGTFGLTGAADTVLVIRRGRGRADAELYVTGRDVEENALALRFERKSCTWRVVGDAEEYRRTQERQEVLDILINSKKPMRPKEIAAVLEKNENAISKTLYRLKEDGLVTQPGYGKYIATCQSGQSSHSDHNSQTCPGSEGTNSD